METDIAVVGGGAIGLAIAGRLAAAGRDVVLIESEARCGTETSTRNNQVLHAGFLYPPGSMKSALCLPGRDALIEFAKARGVPHRLAPKLMPVHSDTERPLLEALIDRGRAANVPGLEIVEGPCLSTLEPAMRAAAALLSTSTAIIDAAALITALEAEAESASVTVARRTRAVSGRLGPPHVLDLESGGEIFGLKCNWLINAAGLGAVSLASRLEGLPPESVPTVYFAKGQFLSHAGATPFRHLVVPAAPALLEAGAALTLDTSGSARFGPDLSFVTHRDYAVTDKTPEKTVAAIARWWPDFDPSGLAPEFSGIRPRMTGPGQPPGDWRVDDPSAHGVDGLIQLFGIDTPGLTACLALADYIGQLVQGQPSTHRSLSQ